jgi:hypothetical protein
VRLPDNRWWISHFRAVLEDKRNDSPCFFSLGILQIDEGTQKYLII